MDMTKKESSADDEGISPDEIETAADETPTEFVAPEVNAETEAVTEWDQPPAASGTAAPKVEPEDEVSIAEQLVNEGTDEADRDRRIAAADPDFEP
jgi:hypothetical protein